MSERAFQIERGPTWDKGKGCDTFGPVGPWLVTADEIADLAGLLRHYITNSLEELAGEGIRLRLIGDYSRFGRELTELLDLQGWPPGMRVIVRKERPHPGAQLRITDHEGMRITAFATNSPRGQLPVLELRHRRRA